MENSLENKQICRLCLNDSAPENVVLVEIFADLINESGKVGFSEKLRKLFDLRIAPDDGLPALVCHKCLNFTDNCYKFREKCIQNDQTLRQLFKVVEETSLDIAPSEEEEDYEEEIIAVDPNQLYESSSEESADEAIVEPQKVPKLMIRPIPAPPPQLVQIRVPPVPPQIIGNDDFKREIYHCRYCDVVFLELIDCSAHEENNHDPHQPFECAICHFKSETHHLLMGHIKLIHSPDKPHVCSQCKKMFIRRADLRKHTFVHAGIRLYSCDICKKSFTHKTNLNKHKRTHSSSEPVKTFKCKLCPQSFFTANDLSSHFEIHMDRSAIACKYCNEAFLSREELDVHQKKHFENNQVQIEAVQPSPYQTISSQPPSVGFYNQIQEPVDMELETPSFPYSNVPPPMSNSSMNFYTDSSSSSRHNFPIINQLLTGMQPQPDVQIKKFVCAICNSTFNKKKEHDRHVTSIHTNLRQFQCDKCPKTFNRKDKLLQHERTHVIPAIFNCSLCPAVFMRQQMLDIHMKAHQFPNGGESASAHIENFLGSLQSLHTNHSPTIPIMPQSTNHETKNGINTMSTSPVRETSNIDEHYPLNLSANKSDMVRINTPPPQIIDNIILDSDDEEDGLRIDEYPVKKRNSTVTSKTIRNLPELKPINPEMFSKNFDAFEAKEYSHESISKSVEGSIQVASKIADMTDKIEPLHDLPMEILND